MSAINLVFPHQLFKESPLLSNGLETYLIEEYLFFRQYAFHKQKLAFHRASMRKYERCLIAQGISVHYIESTDPAADIRQAIRQLAEEGIDTIHYLDPTDNWLEKRIISGAKNSELRLHKYDSPLFLNTPESLQPFFRPEKKKFFQTKFYIAQRKKWEVLLEAMDQPVGGKWSFDAENRKKYPRKKIPPSVHFPAKDAFYEEACTYVEQHFGDNPGELGPDPLYATDFESAAAWFRQFLDFRFAEFGTYEDAIVREEVILNHSVLTPMLNVGLISPQQILQETLVYARQAEVSINNTEGFIRQIIGWREFIRGIYECKGTVERTRNFWGFERKIPASFYNGTTGITPLDVTIQKVLRTGYCHHIERLMVLGNFMLLCEFDPDEVYRWFMELFIDAYDWVMVPNVYGMSQFADGGLMSTKPYISGSNYLLKMSNYGKGEWQETWDALFWRFMHVHRDFFTKNPRLGMLVGTFDRMPDEKQQKLLETAESYLAQL